MPRTVSSMEAMPLCPWDREVIFSETHNKLGFKIEPNKWQVNKHRELGVGDETSLMGDQEEHQVT